MEKKPKKKPPGEGYEFPSAPYQQLTLLAQPENCGPAERETPVVGEPGDQNEKEQK